MRLAGVGMIGVVQANRAVDAIQRLIGRVELGVIPQVVDTVIFIDKGEIAKVQVLEFTVKVPAGMMEADLARPVILISNLETGKSEFEIYTYGEQVVVMPLGSEQKRSPSWKLAEGEVRDYISNYASGPVEVEMIADNRAFVRVRDKDLPKVIGKGGKTIDDIERSLGIHIDVRKFEDGEERRPREKKEHHPIVERSKKHIILNIPEAATRDVEVYAGEGFLFSATVGRHGDIKVRADSEVAQDIMYALQEGEVLWVKEI
jgi:ATPase